MNAFRANCENEKALSPGTRFKNKIDEVPSGDSRAFIVGRILPSFFSSSSMDHNFILLNFHFILLFGGSGSVYLYSLYAHISYPLAATEYMGEQ